MNKFEEPFLLLTKYIADMRSDLLALTSAVQNQPSIDKDRLEQDFITMRSMISPPPFPVETQSLLTVLSTRDVESVPRTLAEKKRNFDDLQKAQKSSE